MLRRLRPVSLLMVVQLALMFATLLFTCALVRQALLLPKVQRGFYSPYATSRFIFKQLPSQAYLNALKKLALPRFVLHYAEPELELGLRGVYFGNGAALPPLVQGRFFSQEEMASQQALAVVGSAQLAQAYERDGLSWINIAGMPFEIIGVMGMNAQTRLDNMLWVPLSAAFLVTDGVGVYYLDAPSPNGVQELAYSIDMLTGNKESAAIDSAIYNTPMNIAQYRALSKLNHTTQLLFAIIALYALALVSVQAWWLNTNRKRIGIQQVLGYSQGEVFCSLLWSFTKLFVPSVLIGLAVLLATAVPAPQDVLLCIVSLYLLSAALLCLHVMARYRAQRLKGRVML